MTLPEDSHLSAATTPVNLNNKTTRVTIIAALAKFHLLTLLAAPLFRVQYADQGLTIRAVLRVYRDFCLAHLWSTSTAQDRRHRRCRFQVTCPDSRFKGFGFDDADALTDPYILYTCHRPSRHGFLSKIISFKTYIC